MTPLWGWVLMVGSVYLLSWLAMLGYVYTTLLMRMVDDEDGQVAYALYPLTVSMQLILQSLKQFPAGWPYVLLGPWGLVMMVNRDMMDARLQHFQEEFEERTVDYVDETIQDAIDSEYLPDEPASWREVN